MTEKEKAALLRMGRERCLDLLERIFTDALLESEFAHADAWFHEYCGAAKMLAALRLISGEEYDFLKEDKFRRLLDAKYPETHREESIMP